MITHELNCLKFEYLGQRPRQNKMSADEAYNLLTRRQRLQKKQQQQQQQQQQHRQRQRQQHRAQASASYDSQASESSGHETSDGNTIYSFIRLAIMFCRC